MINILRPQKLKDVIGQDDIKNILDITINSIKIEKTFFHILFFMTVLLVLVKPLW